MIRRPVRAAFAVALTVCIPSALPAQGGRPGAGAANAPAPQGLPISPAPAYVRTTPPTDPVIQAMWVEGMERSQAMALAQELTDVVGPRLTAAPAATVASDWAMANYQRWGVPVRREHWGTWNSWRRGISHLDLLTPRVRSLEAIQLAWSPGTNGRPVDGDVVLLPDVKTAEDLDTFLKQAKGKFVLNSAPQLSCRSALQWAEFATPESRSANAKSQDSIQVAWTARATAIGAIVGPLPATISDRFRSAGVAGVLGMNWSRYPGIDKIFGSPRQKVPTIDVGCEDYGLLYRLAEHNQRPRVRLTTESEFLGEQPAFNTIVEIRGSEKPDEYIVLSAHYDSWDGASGATDNGTGSITMMEAMRILKATYPRPKRTIVVGHWQGEEQGLNGSRAFSEDHPEIVSGLQALFNQDNGTGRVVGMGPGALPGTAAHLESYLGQIPAQLTQWIRMGSAGAPASGGSDNASFACYGAPAFGLGALGWDYGFTTWHTNRDTYDKLVADDLKNNATLTAMLVYLASEDPQTMPRDRLDPLPNDQRTGQPLVWAPCPKATRKSTDSTR